MRHPYYPLLRASRIRSRRPAIHGRMVVLTIATAILLLEGAPLSKHDEIAQAEPLVLSRSEAPIPLSVAPEPSRRPLQGTDRQPAAPPSAPLPILTAPTAVITCSQPPVGAFLGSIGEAACMRTTIDQASTDDAVRPQSAASDQPAPAVVASLHEPLAVMPQQPKLAVLAPPTPARLAAVDKALTGKWVPRTAGCAKRDRPDECLALVINPKGAKAGPASCRFTEMTRDGNRWNILAQCANDGERWTAHVRLVMAGKRLTWTSERGTQDYAR